LLYASHFRSRLLGWKRSPTEHGAGRNALRWDWVPNSADIDNQASLTLAAEVLQRLGISNPNLQGNVGPVFAPPANPGPRLEIEVLEFLSRELRALDPHRRWQVSRGLGIAKYAQYQHLTGVAEAIAKDPNLRVTLGTDYLITPDVTVGLLGTPTLTDHPWLHAAVACKWTIRSDRVQNIRHENRNMINHRRGRLPHLITVTAEPLPSRLASIARGTGEVDVTYHIAFAELEAAVQTVGGPNQQDEWLEVTSQNRVRDFNMIAQGLVDW
jgi:NgoMIV restriction enzyme